MRKIFTSLLASLAFFVAMAQDNEEWNYIGQSMLSHELPQLLYEDGTRTFYVDTEQSTTRPNVYRLKNPFADMPLREGVTRTTTADNPTYMIVHIEGENADKMWFESFDTGLASEEFGGKVEFCSAASRMILDEEKTVDEIAETGALSFLRYNNWRFNNTYGVGDDARPAIYLRTPNGTVNVNENDGFCFHLPGTNRIIDVITAETFRANGAGEVVPGYMSEASGNPGIKSPATYHFKGTYDTAEESADMAITINEDGTFNMPFQTNLINTVTGGLLRRVTVVIANDSKGTLTGRSGTVSFDRNTSVLVGSTLTNSENIWYPYHGSSTSYVGEEREDYVYFSCGIIDGAKVKRIELEWEFDEGPCKTPTATKSDNPEIFVDTKLYFACATLGSKTYYSVDGGEEIEVQPDQAVTLPWGRHNVKVVGRRFRKQDSELNIEYKVFSAPSTLTDVIELAQLPSSPGTHTVVGENSGYTYTIKGWAYPNDNYMSWYDMSAGIMVGESSGLLKEIRLYHNADRWPKVKQGSILVGWKEGESMTFSHYGGTKRIATIDAAAITADIEAGRPTTIQFANPLDKFLLTSSAYKAIVPYKVEIDWLAPNQKCERPIFPSVTELYDTTPVVLDCITDGADFHVTVNGKEVAYNPEEGLTLPAGKEVRVAAYTTKEGCPDSDVTEAVFHVAPARVADIADLLASAEESMPVEMETALTVNYRNGADAYLTDGTSTVRLIAATADQLGELQAGHTFTGLKATVVADAATPEIRLAALPEELTLGDAPQFKESGLADVAQAAHYSLISLKSVSVISLGDSFIASDGQIAVPLTNRYAADLAAEQGRLFNLSGISEAGKLIPVRVAKITATPEFSLVEGSVNNDLTELAITCSDADAEIYYSIDGAEDTLYTAPFTLPIGGNVKVSARAIAPDMDESDIAATSYTIVSGIDEIRIEAQTQGAEIYTLDGLRVSADNLRPGIYIIRYQGKTKKVMVK